MIINTYIQCITLHCRFQRLINIKNNNMTTAICFKCGKLKFGAFLECPKCGAIPQTEDDIIFSLAITDHYFDNDVLKQIGAEIKAGEVPTLEPTFYESLKKEIKADPLFDKVRESIIDMASEPKKKWWQFWKWF